MEERKRKLSKDAEYVLDLLVAAGHITRETAFQARDIALDLTLEQAESYVAELAEYDAPPLHKEPA